MQTLQTTTKLTKLKTEEDCWKRRVTTTMRPLKDCELPLELKLQLNLGPHLRLQLSKS